MRYFVIVLMLLMLPVSAHKQEAFLAANNLYLSGEYDAALKTYTTLEGKGYGVYYNMGNAYYKKGDYVSALLYWKKAQRVARGAQLRAVLENIEQAEKKLSVSSDLFFHNIVFFWGPYVSYLPIIILQCIWLFFVCMLLISFLRYSGHMRIVGITFCVILLATIGGTMMIKKHLQCSGGALVIDKNSTLFAGPNNQYHQVASIAKGSQVLIYQHVDDWYKIMYGNKTGWIPSSSIVIV